VPRQQRVQEVQHRRPYFRACASLPPISTSSSPSP
jgi:hypothetical protein